MRFKLLLCLALSLSSVAHAAESVEAARGALLKSLVKKHYFKYGTCAEVTNTVLTRNGLPKLGQDGNVRGVRGDMNRLHENEKFPEITDGVSGTKHPIQSVAISTSKDGEKTWLLRLTRSAETPKPNALFPYRSLGMETEFHFAIEGHLNRSTCELSNIVFTPRIGKGKSQAQTFGLSECLDLFVKKGNRASPRMNWQALQTLRWLKQDCAMGLHYFGAVKKIFNQPPRRH